MGPILNQINLVHIVKIYFKTHFNINLPPTPRCPKRYLPSGSPTTIQYEFLISPHSSHLLYLITLSISGEEHEI
jgi:hypothetical protein